MKETRISVHTASELMKAFGSELLEEGRVYGKRPQPGPRPIVRRHMKSKSKAR